jgi:hypothetical protein
VGESGLLGAEWRFDASIDGGRTCRVFATMLGLELHFPAISSAELNAMINAFARPLAQYIPAEKLDEVEAFTRSERGFAGLEEEDSEAQRSSC